MRNRPFRYGVILFMVFVVSAAASAQQTGSIRGVVYDNDFDAPLAAATVTIAETGQQAITSDQGIYLLSEVAPGTYTLVASKGGYTQQVQSAVIVTAGQLTDADFRLSGEFTEMDPFVVQDVLIGGATEEGLINLRMDSPSLLDSISSELMSQAGASDAASALSLVAGATVEDGKFAVIRGLPDRYVNSQLNGIRLPTADEEKRAVELDQFPSSVIESIQVSKTFTPDQQGDASGGAVNVLIKGIPEETILQLKGQLGYNTNAGGRDDFLSYRGGGVNFWGQDDGDRDIQHDNIGGNWDGAAGTNRTNSPVDYKWSLAVGGRKELDNDVTIGGFATFFYERDSAFFDDGVDDQYWVENPGDPMTPQYNQGSPGDGDFKTSLFDVTQGSQSVQWGGLGTIGVETPNNRLGLNVLYTHSAEDKATLAEDTRGKEFYFGPDYDPNDPMDPGNLSLNINSAPYLRTETLEYTERTTQTVQLYGEHTLRLWDEIALGDTLRFLPPELDWYVSNSIAQFDQPDKRQFGELWHPDSFNPGFPPFLPPFISPAVHLPYKPSANFTLGNFQRIWKEIEEDSDQFAINLTLPFEQWTETAGYLKFGIFDDKTDREFNQDTFSNFADPNNSYFGDFDDFWSAVFPDQDHAITDGPPFVDVDYEGEQRIAAWYGMLDLPLTPTFKLVGGVRFESTDLSIVNDPEANATWFPPGATGPVTLLPGDSDVDFSRDDILPAIAFEWQIVDELTLRGSYSETVARQTFRELTPILQQEFLGGPIFIGNPELEMSSLKNYDLRLDYTPFTGGLISGSYFFKDITDPIENVQRVVGFSYTTPVNYPEGTLSGFELEFRQDIGQLWENFSGLSLGANATFIDSEVTLPADEQAQFNDPAVLAPISTRDMTNAPDFLYNLYATYEIEDWGTQFGLFYTVRGDTLVAGAAVSDGNFVPSVYETEYGTLNFSLTQKLGKYFKLQFQAKNLLDPKIQEVYRSDYIGSDVLKTSYTKGIDLSISLSAEIRY